MPFYEANRPGAKVSQGLRDSFWLQGMLGGHKAVYVPCAWNSFQHRSFDDLGSEQGRVLDRHNLIVFAVQRVNCRPLFLDVHVPV